jgi:hypothetical protein
LSFALLHRKKLASQTRLAKSNWKSEKMFLVMAGELMIFAEIENTNVFHFQFWCAVRNGLIYFVLLYFSNYIGDSSYAMHMCNLIQSSVCLPLLSSSILSSSTVTSSLHELPSLSKSASL